MSYIFILLSTLASADELIKTSSWQKIPKIEICPDSPVTKEEIVEAVKYWNSNVDDKIRYTSIVHVNSCEIKKPRVIRVMDLKESKKLNEHSYAVTYYNHWWYNSNPNRHYIENVEVMIPKNHKSIDIIAHELGHAYGYQHSNHSIMKPTF
jgi:predicted Zn-dependent protease